MNPLPDIIAFLQASPFQPFAIFTSDGRKFPVLHPDFLTVTARGKLLYERDERTAAWISPLHVVSVEPWSETATA